MSIDLDKLRPAMERMQRALAEGPDVRRLLLGDVAEVSAACSLGAAAFDVMMRRCWWVVPCSGGVWKVETVSDDASLADKFWPDPFTALVEADRLLPAGEAKS